MLLFLVAVAAGCGGSSGGGGGTQQAAGDKRPVIGGKLVGKMTNCLIDEDWLVQPGENVIQGTSGAGLNFELRFYPSLREAKAQAGKKRVLVENAVFDYGYAGAQNAGVTATTGVLSSEVKTIKKCMAVARS